jgi:hypothetical protein
MDSGRPALREPAGREDFAFFAAGVGAFFAAIFLAVLFFFVEAAFRLDFTAGLRAAFRAVFFALTGFRAAFFEVLVAFFFFFTTIESLLKSGVRRDSDHTIGPLSSGKAPRVAIVPRAGGVTVAIPALAADRGWRWRMAVTAAAVATAALLGSLRLGRAWQAAVQRGDFTDLPLPIMVVLTAALLSAPAALVGLAALAFAEERIETGPDAVVIRTTVFERTRTRTIPMGDLECWRETLWPLAPWWTWAVTRLAARSRGRLHGFGGAATPGEKRAIGLALAAATGKPLLGDFGRRLS